MKILLTDGSYKNTLCAARALKNNNGKVYDKHPAIDKVNKFTSAWISGDTETLKSLTGDNFKMGSSILSS
mgnify:CR=1 FL=1